MIGIGGGFLQDGVRTNHLAWHQVLADAEVLKRALRLRAPEFVRCNVYLAQAVGFFANFCQTGLQLCSVTRDGITALRYELVAGAMHGLKMLGT